MEKTKCLIIGSGPAGYTAAIYAARANLKPVVITGVQMGGQLMNTTDVENYPGYPNGILGPEMMEDFKKQAERMGAEIRFGYVTEVDFLANKQQNHIATIDETIKIEAETIIIATGASAKWLGLPSEQRLNGYGVSACAVCDGFFYKGKEVAIVGAGDTACEEALYLSNLCPTVHMLIRTDKMKASKIMQQRVLSTPNIKVYWNTVTNEILGDKGVNGVNVTNKITNQSYTIPIFGFFVAIGHQPNTAIFKNKLITDEVGYIQTQKGSTKTLNINANELKGVFACGDAQDNIYRQAVTAAGTGCMAALDAERYLSNKEFEHNQSTAITT